ncbi:50S ribosomal protein L27 [Herbaspirillum sp. NPDC087042]|uniref:50S ribosomal protein L27 n=1 Tax=Herbaspirillum sp. NPDC087042 TaxID=3364004 RepID=UPI0038086C8D
MYAVIKTGGKQYKVAAGENVGVGKDHTLFALKDGKVKFVVKGLQQRQYATVVTA